MGRSSNRRTTSDLRALDVRRLQRDGLLTPGQSFGWSWTRNGKKLATIHLSVQFDSVILDYRQREYGGDWEEVNYPVRLDWTACHYGGRRAWWLCPVQGCGRRVAVLYGGTVFACRQCQRLAYASQRETPDARASRRANKLRERLGWNPGILNSNGGKPKGMHWRTFARLQASHDAHAGRSFAGMAERLGLLRHRLGKIKL